MLDPETNPLIRLAGAVADGEPVDWNSERESATSELTSKIRSLEVLDRISSAHRSLHEDPSLMFAETEGSPATGDRWGSLRIVERLGRGAYGEVFRAHDPALQRDVALKLLIPRSASAGDREERFLGEARRLARVRHPNVLIVHGVDRHDGRAGLWTDLLKGKTLEQCLVEQGPFGAREAALVGIDLCRALAAVHAAGLVHRDVKTSNVMREQGGRIVLLDFSSGSDRGHSESPTVAGTPYYMAPELFRGEDSGTAGDVYSLGVLLYRLVSGKYPIVGDRLQDLREAHGSGRAVPLRDVRPDLPTGFVRLVERALSHDPPGRYPSMGEMERDLAAFVGSSPVSGEKTDEPAAWWRRASTWLAASVSVLGVALWAFLSVVFGSFEVDAALFRIGGGIEERLTANATVAPGEHLFLEITGSKSMHVYVLNQDEAGQAFLLFPLPRLDKQNPLRGGVRHRLPGQLSGKPNDWELDRAGGDEWILVAASRKPLPDLERQIADLPLAGSAVGVELSDSSVIGTLRGIGGLSPRPGEAGNRNAPLFGISEQLSDRTAGSSGVWIWEMRLRGLDESSYLDGERLAPNMLAAQKEEVEKEDSVVVSPSGELWLGNRFRESFLSGRRLSTDANLAVRVDEIGRAIARISDRPGVLYRFLVIQGEELQAYSFPGGTVCVTEALTSLLATDDELAFALGHELAHIALRHYIARYRMLRHAEAHGSAEQDILDTVLSQYGSDYEIEADQYGALYAVRAGYSFSKAVEVLDKLSKVPGAVRQDAVHADYKDRIAALQGFRQELERSVAAFHAGTDFLKAGEIAQAIGALHVFVTQFPQAVSGHVNLGAAYLARAREGAPLELAEVLPILPQPGIRVRGMYDRLDLQRALDQFQKALEAEPREAYALAGLALVHIRLRELGLARRYLEQAHETVPNSPEITLCLGNVYFLRGEFENAMTQYRSAASLKEGWSAARKNLAITYERMGRAEQARPLWEKLTADSRLRGEALQRLRDLDEGQSGFPN